MLTVLGNLILSVERVLRSFYYDYHGMMPIQTDGAKINLLIDLCSNAV